MKYNVFYGKPPFNFKLGEVDAPEDRPEVALHYAIDIYAGKHPDGVTVDDEHKYHMHPVVAPQ